MKKGESITSVLSILVLIFIIWFVNFTSYGKFIYNLVGSIFGVIVTVIYLTLFIILIIYASIFLIPLIFNREKRSTNETVLVTILIGAIIIGLIYLKAHYGDEIESGILYIVKIFIGTILLVIPFNFIFKKIYNIPYFFDVKEYIYVILVFLVSLIFAIIIEWLYSDNVNLWLKNYWCYLLGALLLYGLITIFLDKKITQRPK